MNTRDFS